ncbi:MAG TPA: hypothetical protein VNW92_18270 [Polyangiaceae bacterium]|nr:hypothetical protein [Polyangiaceae bacterium]
MTGLLMLSVLTATKLAAADAQECVAQNNAAADQRANHHLLAARGSYRSCVAEPGCPEVVRAECETALSELKTAIPTLLVSVLDAQKHDVVGATLQVDGQTIAVDGSPIEVDPGPHELTAEAQGVRTAMQVVGVEDEANRRVELVLEELHAAPLSSARESEPVVAAAKPRSRVPAYVLGGVGALGAASFGYFAISGHSGLNQLEACKPDCSRSAVHDVRVKYLLADVSLGVSVVALATAGYFLFRPASEAPKPSSSVSLNISTAPQAAGISVRWVE